MAKYDRMQQLFSEQGRTVTLTFDEISEAVGGLPPSARSYREWWANSSSPQARGWLAAGRRVETVNLNAEKVTFIAAGTSDRERVVRRPPGGAASPVATRQSQPVVQRAELPNHVSATVGGTWSAVGSVTLGPDGLAFPQVDAGPGIYRFTFVTEDGVASMYVGESNNVRRRMRNYRRPSPRQQTSTRINALLRARLEAGDSVGLDLLGDVTLEADAEIRVDLVSKAVRVLVEHAALLSLSAAGYEVHNL